MVPRLLSDLEKIAEYNRTRYSSDVASKESQVFPKTTIAPLPGAISQSSESGREVLVFGDAPNKLLKTLFTPHPL
ncbi:hypothetical protein D3C86_1992630 [compost metagenome]